MKKYKVVYADPPWDMVRSFGGANWRNGERKRPLLDYSTMNLDDIKKLPVPSLVDDNAVLYLWTTQHYHEESYNVARCWGFNPKYSLVWCKPKGGFVGGSHFSNIEFLLYCTKGKTNAKARFNTQWLELPRAKHSQKPDEFYQMIEQLHHPPYLELFARQKVEGWDCWGNEVDIDENNVEVFCALGSSSK